MEKIEKLIAEIETLTVLELPKSDIFLYPFLVEIHFSSKIIGSTTLSSLLGKAKDKDGLM